MHRQIVSPAQLPHGYYGNLEVLIRPEDLPERANRAELEFYRQGETFHTVPSPACTPPVLVGLEIIGEAMTQNGGTAVSLRDEMSNERRIAMAPPLNPGHTLGVLAHNGRRYSPKPTLI